MTHATELRDYGYTRLAPWNDANALRARLKNSPTYTGHVIPQGDRVARTWDETIAIPANPLFHACHSLETILQAAPSLLPYIVGYLPLVEEFFGEPALLYSINAFWKRPPDRGGWHYDLDDRKQAVIFIYGTDVLSPEDGVHQYYVESAGFSTEEKAKFHNVEGVFVPPVAVESFYGPAGTAFMTNTNGLHTGWPPKTGARLLIWARFGVSDPPATYHADEIGPVPASKLSYWTPGGEPVRHATHLIVDWPKSCLSG